MFDSDFRTPKEQTLEFVPENAVQPLVVAEAVEEPKTPWGFWMTMVFSLVVTFVFIAVQTGVFMVFLAVAVSQGRISFNEKPEVIQRFAETGWMLAATTWASLPFTMGATYLFVRLRKRWSFGEYIGWKKTTFRQASYWLAATAALAVATDLCTWILGRPLVPEFAKHASQTAFWPPLLWATLLIAAPLFEECFFRGFLFRGLQASRLGDVGAILTTSFLWAVIHIQYDLYNIGVIFLGGILLGTARAVTGSCRLTTGMHFLANLIATLEVYLFA